MISGTTTTTTGDVEVAGVLASARRFRRDANAAEAGVLQMAVEWARLHQVDDLEDAATWLVERGRDTGIAITGDGCPLVSEFAVAEFATALGLTAGSGRVLVAHALELAYRLPRVWARVQAGSLAPWRARRIAEETLSLSPEAAAWVDVQVAPFAHKTGIAQTQRTVETAIARFMPDHAAERRARAAEGQYFTIDHDQVSFAGTSRVHGELDLADALDLEDAVRVGAAQLADLGCTDPLEVRRAAAVGLLARGQQPLDLKPGDEPRAPTGKGRQIVLYVHLSEDALHSHDPNAPVRVENAGGRLLTAGQVADWCGREDTAKIVVKPVIDLHQHAGVDGYQVPESIAERVRLRDPACTPGATGPPGAATSTTSTPTSTATRAARPARRRPTTSRPCADSITG